MLYASLCISDGEITGLTLIEKMQMFVLCEKEFRSQEWDLARRTKGVEHVFPLLFSSYLLRTGTLYQLNDYYTIT